MKKITTNSIIPFIILFITVGLVPIAMGANIEVSQFPNLHFESESGSNNNVEDFVIGPDGELYLVGRFTSVNNIATGNVVRILQDGSVDETYIHEIVFDGGIGSCALQSDGKLVIAARAAFGGGVRLQIMRLNTDGSEDNTFNTGFPANFDFNTVVHQIAVNSLDQIYIAGSFNTIGTIWPSFDPAYHLVRLKADGKRDPSFFTKVESTGLGPDAKTGVSRIEFFPDGRIAMSGYFDKVNDQDRANIAVIHPDGTLDNDFDPGSGPEGTQMRTTELMDLLALPDGKVIVAGGFTNFNGVPASGVVQLNVDGSVDSSFQVDFDHYNNGEPTMGQPLPGVLVRDSEGRIWVSGLFDRVNGQTYEALVRLMPNGSLDSSFSLENGFKNQNDVLTSALLMKVDDVGDLIIIGPFSSFAGISREKILKISINETVAPVILKYELDANNILRITVSNPAGDVISLMETTNWEAWSEVRKDETGEVLIHFNVDLDTSTPMKFFQVQTSALN